ncbi:MAG: hypothetical protein IRZ21_08580 [Thermoleophilaceae bacterium]|nr:hypothetical protein [Thermoleophilaceae bacterium]
MRRRVIVTLLTSSVFLLALQAVAFAADDGEGLAGETDDKLVTFFGLGLALGFTVFVIVMSALQGALERRKQAKKAAALRHRIGW